MSPAAKTSAGIEGVACVMDGRRDGRREGGKGEGEAMRQRCEMNVVLDCRACARARTAAEAPVPISVAHTSPQGAGRAPSTHTHTLSLVNVFHIFYLFGSILHTYSR